MVFIAQQHADLSKTRIWGRIHLLKVLWWLSLSFRMRFTMAPPRVPEDPLLPPLKHLPSSPAGPGGPQHEKQLELLHIRTLHTSVPSPCCALTSSCFPTPTPTSSNFLVLWSSVQTPLPRRLPSSLWPDSAVFLCCFYGSYLLPSQSFQIDSICRFFFPPPSCPKP